MLWYKSWLETRWRFLIGLALLVCSTAGVILIHPKLMALVPMAATIDSGGEIGRRIKESVDLSRTYRGYVWSQLFRQDLTRMGTLFAILLGTGGLFSYSSGGAALFTLSLPVSRNRVVGVRAAAGLAEWLVLAFVPSLLIPVVSPAVGEAYGVGDALAQSACLFVGGSVFFGLAFLLSTVFTDLWRPLLLACAVAVVMAIGGQAFRDVSRYGVFGVMSGEVYFRTGALPWLGLLVSAAATTVMLYASALNVARQDF
jgi:hypothetical protein